MVRVNYCDEGWDSSSSGQLNSDTWNKWFAVQTVYHSAGLMPSLHAARRLDNEQSNTRVYTSHHGLTHKSSSPRQTYSNKEVLILLASWYVDLDLWNFNLPAWSKGMPTLKYANLKCPNLGHAIYSQSKILTTQLEDIFSRSTTSAMWSCFIWDITMLEFTITHNGSEYTVYNV